MSIIKNIMQRVRPTFQNSGEPSVEHPNFWMYQ